MIRGTPHGRRAKRKRPEEELPHDVEEFLNIVASIILREIGREPEDEPEPDERR